MAVTPQPTATNQLDVTPTAVPVHESGPGPTPTSTGARLVQPTATHQLGVTPMVPPVHAPSPGPTPTPAGARLVRPTATIQAGVTPTVTPVHAASPGPTVRGGPPPRIFQVAWMADRDSIAPGEPVTITLELKNVWGRAVVFNEFPTTMTLTHVDTRLKESVPIVLESRKGTPDPIETGETLVVVAAVSTSVSAGLQSGNFRVRGFQFSYNRGEPGSGPTRTSISSETLFVVTPPEGVVERAVTVGQAREANSAKITLEHILLTPEWTIVSVFAEAPARGVVKPEPTGGDTPTPASTAALPPWDGDLTELAAFYRLDEGTWRLIANNSYRDGPEGVHYEWSFDPVSVNAKTLEFAIVPGSLPVRGGAFTYPPHDPISSWEWSVSLTGIK